MIIDRLISFYHTNRIMRFVVIGGVNTLFGFFAFPLIYFATNPLGVHYVISMTMSYVVSISFSYFTNRVIVFQSHEKSISELMRFSTFYAICYAVNVVVLPLCVELFHIPAVSAQAGMVGIIILSSYIWHSSITFRQHERPIAESRRL
jgi:putative flippase GtrA